MSAPLLMAAMIMERRAQRQPGKRSRLVRIAVAALVGAAVLAVL